MMPSGRLAVHHRRYRFTVNAGLPVRRRRMHEHKASHRDGLL
jgi:hypothetical protein